MAVNPCCYRDYNLDGNCSIHKAPGVFRNEQFNQPRGNTMPEFFEAYLKGLSDEQAEALWVWFDQAVLTELAVIDTIAKSHPTVVQKLCTSGQGQKE